MLKVRRVTMATAAITQSADWQDALERAIQEAGVEPGPAAAADLALLFASADYADDL
jgi:hypothetical protein